MARVKRGVMRHKRHKKILERAEGYYGRKRRTFKNANEQVMKSGQYAYRDRRNRKRDFRRLWIARISAACSNLGVKYSHFIHGLKEAGIEVDRKMLSDLAIHDPEAFAALVERAKPAEA
ncbi:MAG: 50S ribosomal protein L20 [Fimbriimonadales bacterium]|nr:MAG: 50S ribosomal protein L20 [Fimbriimonadales bacterium]